jgi:4-aminobutyrate aminotransferase
MSDSVSTHLSNVWFKVTELEVVSGSGCTVTTASGEEYLDFSSGIAVTSTGHCHPKVVTAIREQAGRFIHAQVNVYRHPLLEQLATRLAGITPAGIDTFFFANSGAEATEAAVKLARQATKRQNVIVMDGAFHGRTMMTMAMTTSKTGYRSGYQPLPAGVFVAPFPRPFEWGVDEQTAVERSLRALERLLAAQTAPSETAAIVIEPVLGEGGYIPAPAAYLRGVREICNETGILFVADEVQSGFARTGRMFAVEHAEVVPDIIVMAKGMASGFPIAGIGASAALMELWPQGAHGGTYGGNPIGCAAALATIDVIEQEHLADNARDRGRQLMDALSKLQADNAGIGDVRGLGLMIGTELIGPDGKPAAARTAAILRHCLDESNVIFMNCGTGNNVLRWMPPLIVSAEEIDRGIAAFAAALKATA